MEKLTLINTGLLSPTLLAKNYCAEVDAFDLRNIKTTIPALPESTEISLWTGLNVSQHGVSTLNGNKPDGAMLWDVLMEEDVAVSIEGGDIEVDGLASPDDADLRIINFPAIADAVQKGITSKAMRKAVDALGKIISSCDGNILLMGHCGYTKYSARFNMAVFLQGRHFCKFAGDGIESSETSAYPATMSDDDMQFGIYMNRQPGGWLNDSQADRIQGNVMHQLDRIPNITVMPKARVYEDGKYYTDLPDIVIFANRDVIMPTLGRDRFTPIEAYGREYYSINALMGTNFHLHKFLTKPTVVEEISSLVYEYFSIKAQVGDGDGCNTR